MTTEIPTISSHHTMMLVMDYQPAALHHLPDANGLLSRMPRAIDMARRSGVRIGYVRMAFDDADYAAMPKHDKTLQAIASGRRLHAEAPETAVHHVLAPEPDDLVVRKTRFGAFSTTDLDQQLHDRNIDTLILAGIITSGVVLTTVREAADRDYHLYVLEDGCADRDQDINTFLIRKIFPRQAHVLSIADLAHLLVVIRPFSVFLTKEYITRTLSVEELTDLTLALEKVRAVLAEDYAYRRQRQKE
jgi:nicotinamidase-related amidase